MTEFDFFFYICQIFFGFSSAYNVIVAKILIEGLAINLFTYPSLYRIKSNVASRSVPSSMHTYQ